MRFYSLVGLRIQPEFCCSGCYRLVVRCSSRPDDEIDLGTEVITKMKQALLQVNLFVSINLSLYFLFARVSVMASFLSMATRRDCILLHLNRRQIHLYSQRFPLRLVV